MISKTWKTWTVKEKLLVEKLPRMPEQTM